MSEGARGLGPHFGRVDSDGTVYVRTADGERASARCRTCPPRRRSAFFIRRFEALELEVSLLERRIASGALSPDDAVAVDQDVRRRSYRRACRR